MSAQPKMTDVCSTCQHPFSEHWITFDGKKMGCSNLYVSRGYGNDTSRCTKCTGFTITWKPVVNAPTFSGYGSIGYGGKGEPYGT